MTPATLPAVASESERRAALVSSWIAGRSPRTAQAYRSDLDDFRRFLGAPSPDDAVDALLAHGPGAANALALNYRSHLIGRGLASASINRRLTALRSLVSLAQLVGFVPWSLRVQGVRREPRRDTRGPNEGAVRQLFTTIAARTGKKGLRDRAILRLLVDLGLRRAEVASLDLEHLDLACARVAVLGKGRKERQWLVLPDPTCRALRAWLHVRGSASGPLFVGFTGLHARRRLEPDGIYRMVAGVGRAAGIPNLRTHGLRHSAITIARARAHARGLPIEEVLDFSRHVDVRTLQAYLDRDRSRQGELAAMVADAFT